MAVVETSQVRRVLARAPADAIEHLAATFGDLGWHPMLLRAPHAEAALSLAAGGLPQILVTTAGTVDSARSVSLGYSHESVLTLDWGQEAIRLHASAAWRVAPGDAPLLEVSPDDVAGVAQVLNAVSRDRFEVLASESSAGRHPPLADLLARSFADFRRQVVDSELIGAGPGELAALRLFHQLLFMRFHEDRFAIADDLRVGRALDSPDIPALLGQQLRWYAGRFNSELFADVAPLDQLPQRALRNVLHELVEPWEMLRLDFSVTANEVAGRLYQSYLRLAPARVEEGRLFPGAEIRSQQKQHGSYYTPAPVADFVVRETLSAWLSRSSPTRIDEVRVIDPACGSGAFLVAAYRILLRYWQQQLGRVLTEEDRSAILSASIFGVDADTSAVLLCRIQLLEEAGLANLALPGLANNIADGDSLTSFGLPDAFLAPRSYNVVVTNPPFAAPRLAALKAEFPAVLDRFPSLRGTGRNFAYAFAELALDLLAPGGRAGLILPRALLDGPSSSAAREVLGAEHLLGVLDFGRNIVFDSTLAYVAAIILSREPQQEMVAARLRDDLVPKADVLDYVEELSLAESDASSGISVVASLTPSTLGNASWAPFTLRWRSQLKEQVGIPTVPLGSDEAPAILIGTQTGADQRFVLEPSSYRVDRGRVVVDGVAIPARFAPRWIKGAEILPFRLSPSGARVVVPLTGEDPRVDALIQVRGGTPTSFRPGQLALLRKPKVLVKNLFSEPAAAVDLDGLFMPPQGVVCALVSRDESTDEMLLAEALLNSSFYQWLLQGLAHPRAGGYSRLMAHHWEDVPWPRLTEPTARQVREAGSTVRAVLASADEGETGGGAKLADSYWRARHLLDAVVFEAMHIEPELRAIVSSELWRLA